MRRSIPSRAGSIHRHNVDILLPLSHSRSTQRVQQQARQRPQALPPLPQVRQPRYLYIQRRSSALAQRAAEHDSGVTGPLVQKACLWHRVCNSSKAAFNGA